MGWRRAAWLPALAWLGEVVLSGLDGTTRFGPDLPAWVMAAIALPGAAALLWRRDHPWLIFTVAMVHSVGLGLFSLTFQPGIVLYVAIYTVARFRPWREITVAVVLSLIPWYINSFVNFAAGGVGWTARGSIAPLPVFLIWTAFALVVVALATSERRAHDVFALHERTAEAVMAMRLQGERMRIARELHDRVASSIAAVTFGIEGLQRRSDPDTEDAASLDRTYAAAKEAMSEVRSVLKVLEAVPPPTDAEPIVVPFDALLHSLQVSGWGQTAVDVTQIGQSVPLRAEVEECASRCLIIAVSNAARHNAARVRVQIDWRTDPVTFEIVNPAPVLIDQRTDQVDPAVSSGVGVGSIIHRVTGLGGEVRLHSDAETFRLEFLLPH